MKQGTKGLLAAALVGVAAFAMPATSKAGQLTTTLDTLLPGGNQAGGITLGDKRYSNFTFASSGDDAVLPRDVDVTLSNDASGNQYTLRFAFDALGASPTEQTDVVICYQVDVLGNQLINGVGLVFNSTVAGGNGDAAASVIETVSSIDPDGAGPLVAPPVVAGSPDSTVIIDVFNDGTGNLPDEPSTSLAVNPTRSLQFCKDILVSSRAGGGTVSISTVDNIVNQVPEPASIGILAAAAGSLLLRRRRD